jgi:cystathionine gamma-synthase
MYSYGEGEMKLNKYKVETALAQIGNRSEKETGAVNPPVYFSTAYRHDGIGSSTGFDYTRTGNPTRKIVEQSIASLEGGDCGFAYSSGMAAIHTLLCLFKPGDKILVSNDLYGGTYRLFEQTWKTFGISFQYCNSIEEFESALSPNTRAVFIETPTNPLMQEIDLSNLAKISKRSNVLLIVDNTFYTPVLQRPIEAGADIVIHSATKYLGGHNDVLAGLVVAKGKELSQKLADHQNASGAVLSPFDSWLLIKGMKTLALRMKQHEENAKKLYEFLIEKKEVTEVLYPGRGGMMSFRLQKEKWIDPFLKNLQLISFAESLGGVESFITYPATQTHADIPEEVRVQNGICNRLLRFSVGIEHVDDLIEDFNHAFQKLKEISVWKGERDN